MPDYDLTRLGTDEFENLSQALLKKIIGSGTITFGSGPDGGREATYSGSAPYPSPSERWSGEWVFQAKFYDIPRISPDAARRNVLSDLQSELEGIARRGGCDNYVLITNAALSSVAGSGSHDRIAKEIAPNFSETIKHVHVWGSDEVSRFLDVFPEVRVAYLHYLTPGDLIASLLRGDQPPDTRATAVRLFLATSFSGEEKVQLDQAGEAEEDQLRLRDVYIDLEVELDKPHLITDEQWRSSGSAYEPGEAISSSGFLMNPDLRKVVLIGGPGEGKSTIGQYVSQVHRAALLGNWSALCLDISHFPKLPRIPFRVVLKDYADWVSRHGAPDANQLSAQGGDANLDSYLADEIARGSSRDVTAEDVQDVLSENPCLLILDGLDEVTDQSLRRVVLQEAHAFINRCEVVLGSNLQVIATTRPSSYFDEFERKDFVHVRLSRLSPEKVAEYVDKWVHAKDLNEPKGRRLKEIITESYADPQIRALMNTPLQVTILILIVQTGGTPPRQREALFDEYLEIVYKRERAKARSIIQTEKELLFGLHQYIGFILQSRAGQASRTSSVLKEDEYIDHVRKYLQLNDPYSAGAEREKQVDLIVREARERFVLIVELQDGAFGFELRSLQEFFAAGHLTDSATGSGQRFSRFRAVAPWAHWRNTTLFFAGRIGRTCKGEAANILEECKNIDRTGPDELIRRGSWLALELGAESVFVPNRPMQMSILEYGLSIVEHDLSQDVADRVLGILGELPAADIRDLVSPALDQMLRTLKPPYTDVCLRILHGLQGDVEAVRDALVRDRDEFARGSHALQLALDFCVDPEWVVRMSASFDWSEYTPVIAQMAELAVSDPEYFRGVCETGGMFGIDVEAILESIFKGQAFGAFRPSVEQRPWSLAGHVDVVLMSVEIMRLLKSLEEISERMLLDRKYEVREVGYPGASFRGEEIQTSILERAVNVVTQRCENPAVLWQALTDDEVPILTRAVLWVLRFVIEDVDRGDLDDFVRFVRDYATPESTPSELLIDFADVPPPHFRFTLASLLASTTDADIDFDPGAFLGTEGSSKWFASWEAILTELRSRFKDEWNLVALFGPAALGEEAGSDVEAIARKTTGLSLDEAMMLLRGALSIDPSDRALDSQTVKRVLEIGLKPSQSFHRNSRSLTVNIVCWWDWSDRDQDWGCVADVLEDAAKRDDIDPKLLMTLTLSLGRVLDLPPTVVRAVLSRVDSPSIGFFVPRIELASASVTKALSAWIDIASDSEDPLGANAARAATALFHSISRRVLSRDQSFRSHPEAQEAMRRWLPYLGTDEVRSTAAVAALRCTDLNLVQDVKGLGDQLWQGVLRHQADDSAEIWIQSIEKVVPPTEEVKRAEWEEALTQLLREENLDRPMRQALLRQLEATVAASVVPSLEAEPSLGLPVQ